MSAVLVVGVAALLTGAALWFFFGPLRTEEEPQRRARQEGRHANDQNCAHLQPPPIGIWSAAVRSRSSRTTRIHWWYGTTVTAPRRTRCRSEVAGDERSSGRWRGGPPDGRGAVVLLRSEADRRRTTAPRPSGGPPRQRPELRSSPATSDQRLVRRGALTVVPYHQWILVVRDDRDRTAADQM